MRAKKRAFVTSRLVCPSACLCGDEHPERRDLSFSAERPNGPKSFRNEPRRVEKSRASPAEAQVERNPDPPVHRSALSRRATPAGAHQDFGEDTQETGSRELSGVRPGVGRRERTPRARREGALQLLLVLSCHLGFLK